VAKKILVLPVFALLLMVSLAGPVLAARPTLTMTCVFNVGIPPALQQLPVQLPEESHRLTSYRMECNEHGGHLEMERGAH